MRLCRFEQQGKTSVGFYDGKVVVPLSAAAVATGTKFDEDDSLLSCLTNGQRRAAIRELQTKLTDRHIAELGVPVENVQLLVPIAAPNKLLLLAGNYSKHIEEGGGKSEERSKTFPYVFIKPPSTTLTHPGNPVKIPASSPDHIDWELELGVIIGRRCKDVKEAQALDYVAGYTVINDISDRQFRPNSGRTERPKDSFFDWLHGKWHDTFCPMGPCVLPADELADPQKLRLELRVNGNVEQSGSTSEMIFPVAAVIEFISSFVTLEPGDVISTGTTSGVGAAKGKFLKAGDVLEAEIAQIGVLRNPVE